MSSPKSLETLARLSRSARPVRPPALRIRYRSSRGRPETAIVREVSKCGGQGRVVLVGDDWSSKGYWLLYYRHAGYLYRIWTSDPSKRELRAWLRWFRSAAFRREHEVSIDPAVVDALPEADRPFKTNPVAPAEGVWLGWRRRFLRPQPADIVPDWVRNYSRLGCALQRYPEVPSGSLLRHAKGRPFRSRGPNWKRARPHGLRHDPIA